MANIPHYLRLKPKSDSPDSSSKESLIETQTEHHIKFKETATLNKFTKIFNEISQLDLYKETLQDLTHEILDDKDSVFFTLGPSNSGKSYSVYGDDSNPGVSIYALNEIFNKITDNFADYNVLKRHFGDSFLVSSNANRNGKDGEYGLSISVFEVYNDRIRDLSLDSAKTVNQSLDIITDAKDGKIKPNKIRQIYVANLNEAKLVLHKSIKRRAVSSTNINLKSSRSHLFIYFNLHKVIGKNIIRTSRLTIADLAGSERTKSAKTEGKEFKEGNYTNQSLTELGRCLSMMKSKKFDRSILRTSKLTRLLLTDLFGNLNQNRIKILLTLDPYSSLSTILHAIRYIQPVAKVTINSERNSLETSDNAHLSQLTEEMKLLREINQSLEAEKTAAGQKLLELEFQLRSELNQEYEEKIKELEYQHSLAINDLKNQNQESTDKKLELLSQDYDERIQVLVREHESQLKDLENSYEAKLSKLNEDYEAQLNDLSRFNEAEGSSLEKELARLKNEIKELQESNVKTQQALISDVTKERREKDELTKELRSLKKLLNHSKKEEEVKSAKIKQLETELEQTKNKRKSDVMLDTAQDKTSTNKKAKIDESSFENKENELSSLSPIRIQHKASSPAKHFKFTDDGLSPLKPKLVKMQTSPSKVLKVINFDDTLPNPKVRSKSPSKSSTKSPKKKLLKHPIVDESF